MQPRFLFSLVLALAGSAGAALAQTPNVSVRSYLPGDSQVGLASTNQLYSAISAGSTGFLAAWGDRRAQPDGIQSAESMYDVWARRLAPDGTPLEPTPLCLGFVAADDITPDVSWSGSAWLVIWLSRPPGASNFGTAVYGVRVAADGTLLDAAPIEILTSPTIQTLAVASDGQGWLVACNGTVAGQARVIAKRVSAGGVLLDNQAVILGTTYPFQGFDLAWAQGAYLLAWSGIGSGGNFDIIGRRFDAGLSPLDALPFVIGSTPDQDSNPVCASSGAGFFVAWSRVNWTSYTSAVLGARVSAGGAVLDPGPLAISPSIFLTSGGDLGCDWDGTQWWVSFSALGARVARVSSAGVVLDFNGFQIRPGATQVMNGLRVAGVATGGVCVTWTDGRHLDYDTYATRVDSPSALGVDIPLSTGAPAQLSSDMASSGSGSALVFRSESGGAARILVERLDQDGHALDAQPIECASHPDAQFPSIAWDGTRYAVAWIVGQIASQQCTILLRRMASDGTWLDAAPIQLGVGTAVDVAGRNGEFLVAFSRTVNQPPLQRSLAVTRVRGLDGAILSGPTTVSNDTVVQVDVCALPGGYVLGWQRNTLPTANYYEIAAALVDPSGVPSAAFTVGGQPNTYNGGVSVAASGTEVLFAWYRGVDFQFDRRVDTRRMSFAGTFLDPAPVQLVSSGTAEQFWPRVAWDGTQYVCVFQDLRNGPPGADPKSDVYGARVLSTGFVRDPQGFPLERTAASEVRPAILGLGNARALMASSILRPESGLASYRIATRVFDGDCVPPNSYCVAKLTSIGTLPAIGFSGQPSVGANNLQITLSQAVPNVLSMLLSSAAPATIPFFNGTLCLQPPIVRGARVTLDATGSGAAAIPLSGELLGSVRYYQWWARDPHHPDGTGISLSNGLRVPICP